MTKEEVKQILDQEVINIGGELWIPIGIIPQHFTFDYQTFYNFLLENNTSEVIRYRKLNVIKVLEYNDILLELVAIFEDRTTSMIRLKEIKKIIKK